MNLTHEQIDALEDGALDKAVAEYVIGAYRRQHSGYAPYAGYSSGKDMHATWQVASLMLKAELVMNMWKEEPFYVCTFGVQGKWFPDERHIYHEIAATAICRAALHALADAETGLNQ